MSYFMYCMHMIFHKIESILNLGPFIPLIWCITQKIKEHLKFTLSSIFLQSSYTIIRRIQIVYNCFGAHNFSQMQCVSDLFLQKNHLQKKTQKIEIFKTANSIYFHKVYPINDALLDIWAVSDPPWALKNATRFSLRHFVRIPCEIMKMCSF